MCLYIGVFISFLISHAQNSQTVSDYSEINLYQGSVEALDSYEKISLQDIQGKPSLWVLFQPDCKSCHKQLADLKCLPKDWPTIAVGFWGSKDNLKRVLRGAQFNGLKAMASKDLEEKLNPKNTPTLLFVNSQGQIQKKMNHRLDCNQVKINMNNITNKDKQ